MRTKATGRLAWSLAALSVASVAGGAVIDWVMVSRGASAGDPVGRAAIPLAGMAFAAVGLLIIIRARNKLGWVLLLMGFGISFGAPFCSSYADYGAMIAPGSLPGAGWAAWLSAWVPYVALFGYVPVFLLFPDGRLPSRRWRPVTWLFAIAALFSGAWMAFRPYRISFSNGDVQNPLGIAAVGRIAGVLVNIGGLALLFATVAAIVSLFLRRRRADAEQRLQLRWLAYAGIAILVALPAFELSLTTGGAAGYVGLAVSVSVLLLGPPVAIAIAVLKYRLYDIDVVINKTLVYGLLAAFITAVYVGIVVGIGQAIGSKRNLGLSILATAVVAVGFQPVRNRVQHLANRLVYGKRATPYEVLSEFSDRMSGAYATEDLLPRMARILGEGTGASRASVWLRVGSNLKPEASWPADAATPAGPLPLADGQVPTIEAVDRVLPVRHQGELLGALSVTKAKGDPLRPAEGKLMEDLASGAGLVLRNVRLTAELLQRLEELQASRQRIVAAQDEERRRLERNIHDGAQQQLVALQVRLSLAERAAEDGCRVKDQIASLKAEAGEALQNLRDLARGIYPPLLADQGLQAALTAQARRAAVPVRIEASGIARYPQDQEAAVYFCCLEALQNVAKYARAAQATVRLFDADGELAFEVTDDGRGFDASTTSYGTGLQGMADRLAAQGGTLEVRSAPSRGTTVTGRMPVSVLGAVG